MTTHATLAFASPPATPGDGSAPASPGMTDFLLPIALMFGIVYFLILRPQQKKADDQKKLVTNLKKGDYVVTLSGIYGRIIEVEKKALTLEIASNVRVKFRVDAIAGIDRPEEEAKP